MNRRHLIPITVCFMLWLSGCRPGTKPLDTATPSPIPFTPVTVFKEPTPSPVPAPTTMTQWQELSHGLDFLQRYVQVGQTDDWVTTVRFDPRTVSVRVRYAPATPHSVREWYDALNVDVVINAGFFTPEKRAAGLIISDGKRYGQTYKGFGGMFSMRGATPSLQWLARQPYVNDQRITQAVQSFPMLIVNGQIVPNLPDDGNRSRRSFIGVDRQGRVVLGVCQSAVWTMTDLAKYLANNPFLGLVAALNLDGGTSTGLWVRGVSEVTLVDSIDTVPEVITVQSGG